MNEIKELTNNERIKRVKKIIHENTPLGGDFDDYTVELNLCDMKVLLRRVEMYQELIRISKYMIEMEEEK